MAPVQEVEGDRGTKPPPAEAASRRPGTVSEVTAALGIQQGTLLGGQPIPVCPEYEEARRETCSRAMGPFPHPTMPVRTGSREVGGRALHTGLHLGAGPGQKV